MIHGILHSAWWMMWIGVVLVATAASLDAPQDRGKPMRLAPRTDRNDAAEFLGLIGASCMLYALYLAWT